MILAIIEKKINGALIEIISSKAIA